MPEHSSNPNFVRLLNELCSQLGCCGGSADGRRKHVTDYIPATGLVMAEEFAVWTLQAEGIDPEYRQDLRRAIRSAFIKHMGTSSVSAGELVG